MTICEICGRSRPNVRNRICKSMEPCRRTRDPSPDTAKRRKREAARLREKRKNAAYLAMCRKNRREQMAITRECKINRLERNKRDRERMKERDATEPGFRARRLAKSRAYSQSPGGKAARAAYYAKHHRVHGTL
jgi:hypothetical protein